MAKSYPKNYPAWLIETLEEQRIDIIDEFKKLMDYKFQNLGDLGKTTQRVEQADKSTHGEPTKPRGAKPKCSRKYSNCGKFDSKTSEPLAEILNGTSKTKGHMVSKPKGLNGKPAWFVEVMEKHRAGIMEECRKLMDEKLTDPEIDALLVARLPEMDALMAARQPEMDAPMAARQPEMDSKPATGHPKMDALMILGQPGMDAPMEAGQPEMNLKPVAGQPEMDSKPIAVRPEMDAQMTLRQPEIDAVMALKQLIIDCPEMDTPRKFGQPEMDTPGQRGQSRPLHGSIRLSLAKGCKPRTCNYFKRVRDHAGV